MFYSFGETTAVHDAGVTVWKNKVLKNKLKNIDNY